MSMTDLTGGDSATPKPTRGRDIWGVYVAGDAFHVWTKEEVAALDVKGCLPIVVPPQGIDWWSDNHGYAVMEQLVRDALAWGVPEGSPLVLDVEEYQSAQMGPGAQEVCHAWAVACRTHNLVNWTYGSKSFLAYDMWGLKWLAEWPEPTPTSPELPHGFEGWQYANDGDIDLDLFQEHRVYMTPDRRVVAVPGRETLTEESTETSEESGAPLLDAPQTAGDAITAESPAPAAPVSDTVSGAAEVASESVTPPDATPVSDSPEPASEATEAVPEPTEPSVTFTLPPAIESALNAIREWFHQQ